MFSRLYTDFFKGRMGKITNIFFVSPKFCFNSESKFFLPYKPKSQTKKSRLLATSILDTKKLKIL